jgi:hypothetical protein
MKNGINIFYLIVIYTDQLKRFCRYAHTITRISIRDFYHDHNV